MAVLGRRKILSSDKEQKYLKNVNKLTTKLLYAIIGLKFGLKVMNIEQ